MYNEEIAAISAFLDERVLIVIPVLWALGVFLKSTPKVKDWLIVWIILIVGIALTLGVVGVSTLAVIQGVLVSAVAALGYDVFYQTKKGIEGPKK